MEDSRINPGVVVEELGFQILSMVGGAGACVGTPEKSDDDGAGEGTGCPEADGQWPAVVLGKMTRDHVARGCAHVAHEIHEAYGGSGSAATRKVHGQCADEEHLRSEDAETNQEENKYRGGRAPVNDV